MIRSTPAPLILSFLIPAVVIGVLIPAAPAAAEVKPAALIGDHMVVQQGKAVHVWGTATAGESVTASMAGAKVVTRGDAAGQWSLVLPALQTGGPYTLTLKGTNALSFTDVWSGEVWVASGQSNMEFPLSRSFGADGAVAGGCSGLRLFTVTKATSADPKADVEGLWEPCDDASAQSFSAVAFYFGQELHRVLGVPVGLIHSSWGGTPAEAWTPRAALVADPSFKPMVDAFDSVAKDPVAKEEIAKKIAEWEARNFHHDTGNTGFAQGSASLDGGAGWSKMDLPQFWETAGLQIDGAVWFRRDVAAPADWAGHDLALSLGPLDDFDTTYWNGEKVGATGEETPQYWSTPRHYTVPGRLVKGGRNVLAVRVFDHVGNGGFGGSPAQMTVAPVIGAGVTLPLAGPWDYRIERELPPAAADYGTRPNALGADDPNSPTVLWNAMIQALTPFPVGGAVWYQGESNADRAYQYRTLFPTMIRAWRDAWRQPDMPFLFVQLANFNALAAYPGESDWAELREAQTMTLALPHTGMAVILDIGEADDIHPRDKKDVGLRLALQALKKVYGKDVVSAGPTFGAWAREGAAMRVRFENLGGGLVTADGVAPRGFAVAGTDHQWHWAEARIDGDSVIVSSAEVTQPVAVRYGWADNPPNTLRNKEGLPAAPFRSDDWPGLTGPR